MKTLLITSIILISKIVLSNDAQQQIFNSYLNIKNALVKSDAVVAQAEAKTGYNQLVATDEFDERETILKSLTKIAATNDLEKQRVSFSNLSVALWKVIKSNTQITTQLYYNYCPMKKAYWISETETIQNPYYGNRMLNCGSIKEAKI